MTVLQDSVYIENSRKCKQIYSDIATWQDLEAAGGSKEAAAILWEEDGVQVSDVILGA